MRSARTRTQKGRLAALALAVASLGAAALAPAAAAEVEWTSELWQAPTNLPVGGDGLVRIMPENVGDTTSSGTPTIEFTLPAGVTLSSAEPSNFWSCAGSGIPQEVVCSNPFGFFASTAPNTMPNAFGGVAVLDVAIPVDIAADAPQGHFPFAVTLEGAGGAPATRNYELWVDDVQLPFGPTPGSLRAGAFDEAGDDYTQAGGHPYEATVSFAYNTRRDPNPANFFAIRPQGSPKDVVADLPAGFAGDPSVTPKCESLIDVRNEACPASTQVGVGAISPPYALSGRQRMFGVYNVEPPKGAPAQFAFHTIVGNVLITPVLRSDGGWGLAAHVHDITQIEGLLSSEVTLWGVPADPSHDALRCAQPNVIARACVGYDEAGFPTTEHPADIEQPHSAGVPRKPFLSNPTRCTGQPDVTSIHLSQWQAPGAFQPDGDPDLTDTDWVTDSVSSPPLTGCEALAFDPTLKARPTTNGTDSPSGLDVDLHVPQSEDPDGLATAQLRKAVVTLPEGLVINPSGANGLDACTEAQARLDTRLPDQCPEQAKIGTVSVETPAIDHPLPGAVYVATPFENPAHSLLAIYLTIDDPESGIAGKLVGKVVADPQTGRLTTTVEESPQVPFEDFHLDFFGGATAALRTPATCGNYSTTSQLTPWSAPQSGPPATPSDNWSISRGPGGASCASSEAGLPNSPSFDAGSASAIAGAYSPFVIDLRRDDATQQFGSVTLTPPPGLLAKLAGTAICPDSALAAAAKKSGAAEQASPSCPAASAVGTAIGAAGAGPAPYHVSGRAYLAGPYNGAPMSLAIVTPAAAGPFDLGTVVVRTALHLDPRSAQITAVSDPIPQILEGIPLDVRSVSIRLDRPQFTLNPTSCEPGAVNGQLVSTLGNPVSLAARFQVGECGRLGFRPRLRLSLKGGTERGDYPALTAVLKPRQGDANIASLAVSLPRSEFLAQEHIRTVCTRVRWAEDACPKASIYGRAVVTTPLLDYKLTGPVYLRSSDNTLPDLVPDLRGPASQPIRLESAGRTDSIDGGIRNTFAQIPDAPFTKLVLRMQGGKKSLLVNSTDICAGSNRASVRFGAHNGRTFVAQPLLRAKCGHARKGKGKKHGK